MSGSWKWINPKVIHAIHEEQLAEHGGITGTRDEGLLQSALARPLNLARYGKPGAAELAAAYGYGIARNHPFLDGNKRAAFVAMNLFLTLNGWELLADDTDCVLTILKVSEGHMSEADFAAWITASSHRVDAR